jgi:molybdenum cofactor cytidylyltransferase
MIPAVVLAAGRSTRMGRTKANLPAQAADAPGADTFLTRIVRTLVEAGVDDVVVVVGHDRELVMERFAASGLSARFVENPDHDSGQLSSLVAGLRVVDRPGVRGLLMTLVDVPFVSAETVRAVLGRYKDTNAPVVRPTRGSQHGHPVLIDRALFEPLRQADPAGGAKAVVRGHATSEGDVEVRDPGAFADIDTPEDYARALRELGGDRS